VPVPVTEKPVPQPDERTPLTSVSTPEVQAQRRQALQSSLESLLKKHPQALKTVLETKQDEAARARLNEEVGKLLGSEDSSSVSTFVFQNAMGSHIKALLICVWTLFYFVLCEPVHNGK